MSAPPEPASTSPALGRVAAWVLVVQCLLALSWTLYVVFLPGLLATAGIDKRWFVVVLIADQVVFAASDWAAGVYADRIAGTMKRTGRLVLAVTMVSSAALLATPWLAALGSAPLFLAIVFVWVATSSALRAPVFALLGRIHGPDTPRRAGLVSLALVGISLSFALSPFLALWLKGFDARWPLGLSALSLVVAGLWTSRAEDLLPRPEAGTAHHDVAYRRRRAWTLAGIVLVATFGTQVGTNLAAAPLFARFVGADASFWVAWFWIGVAIGLVPGTRFAHGSQPLLAAAGALVMALVAFAGAEHASSLAVLTIATFATGACWGTFVTIAFNTAVSLSSGRAATRGAGTASGMLFSAIAVATVGRLALVAAGQGKAPAIALVPPTAWALASALLVLAAMTLWKASPADG